MLVRANTKRIQDVVTAMPIYTGGGDEGTTALRSGVRVSKTHPRIEAYGSVDELNAVIGIARGDLDADVEETLADVQDHLHVLQAELATPDPADRDVRIDEEHASALEDAIDEADAELEPLRSFIIPGGSEAGSRLHHARTVCRRAERRVLGLGERESVSEDAIVYLNRLSDLLFVLARLVNHRAGVEEQTPNY